MKIGFHASHEQFTPRHLLELVQEAEQAGFNAVLSSDHFHPWSNRQGESGFAWSWLGAAMSATNLEYGIVNAPGQRYHPAIIAQAAATLDQMFPGRFWLCQGSGQAINENITGDKWPSKEVRNARLKESVEIIRELWKGDYVTRHGIINIENAKLFTPPETIPTIYGAAITEKTASWLSAWADGMITISKPLEDLEKMVEAFRQNDKNTKKPLALKVQISYAPNEDDALKGAWDQWKNNIFPSKLLADINTAEQFDALGDKVRKEDIKEHVIIGSQADVFIGKINEFAQLGFEKIIIHNVNRDQENFIEFFGKEVLPQVKLKSN
ncbi:TIGR03885 family FMN-dependent LLM class oxidoreductase [soil metagenome]